MGIICLRGATTVDENSENAIYEAAKTLTRSLMSRNGLKKRDMLSIIFSCTPDLTKAYPAAAAREMGLTACSYMCLREMAVEGSLPKTLRLLAFVKKSGGKTPCHVYLKGAKILRPDYAAENAKGPVRVAIDGPAGAGKSTAARLAASGLGFVYLDSGAVYRAIALNAVRNGVDISNEAAVSAELKKTRVKLNFKDGAQITLLGGADVSADIRADAAAKAASAIAAYRAVRTFATRICQEAAKQNNIVMDGRDIAARVLPNAQVKIYLDASAKIRAQRRAAELAQQGETPDLAEIESEIIKRDEFDKTRKLDPLRRHKNAVYINSDGKTAKQVSRKIIKIAERVMENL